MGISVFENEFPEYFGNDEDSRVARNREANRKLNERRAGYSSPKIDRIKSIIKSVSELPYYPGQKSYLEDLQIELHNAQVEYEEEVLGYPRIGY